MAGGPIGQNSGVTGTSGGQGFGPAVDNFSGPNPGLDDRNYGTGISPTLLDTFNPKVPLPQGMQGSFGQPQNPFRSILPVFTQSGQANAVFDPSSDPRLALANRQQFNALKRQQQYVTDPMQELYKQGFVNRYMDGRMGGREMQGMPTGMAFQQLPITMGNRTNNNYYQATPFGAAGAGIASLLR